MVATLEQLEKRIEHVEHEVVSLQNHKTDAGKKPWWEQIVGDYANDSDFDEIIELGKKWRKQQQEP